MSPEATKEREKTIEYFVNGERQTTTDKKLKVSEILTRAGFDPAQYTLKRDDGNKVLANDDIEEIHPGERFTATYSGPTPTS